MNGLLYEVFTTRFFQPRAGEHADCQALVDAGLAVPCAQGKLAGYQVSPPGYRVSPAGYRAVMARWGHRQRGGEG